MNSVRRLPLFARALPVAECVNDIVARNGVELERIHIVIADQKIAQTRIVGTQHGLLFGRIRLLVPLTRQQRRVKQECRVRIDADISDGEKLSA